MSRHAYRVDQLPAMMFPRQGDLFFWAATCRDALSREIAKGLDDDHWDYAAAKRRAFAKAGRASVYRGIPSWATLAGLIYERDGGTCWICGEQVEGDYECAHLQDRACGGLDIPENLVCSHRICNRLMPVCESADAARAWRGPKPKGVGWWMSDEAIRGWMEQSGATAADLTKFFARGTTSTQD